MGITASAAAGGTTSIHYGRPRRSSSMTKVGGVRFGATDWQHLEETLFNAGDPLTHSLSMSGLPEGTRRGDSRGGSRGGSSKGGSSKGGSSRGDSTTLDWFSWVESRAEKRAGRRSRDRGPHMVAATVVDATADW